MAVGKAGVGQDWPHLPPGTLHFPRYKVAFGVHRCSSAGVGYIGPWLVPLELRPGRLPRGSGPPSGGLPRGSGGALPASPRQGGLHPGGPLAGCGSPCQPLLPGVCIQMRQIIFLLFPALACETRTNYPKENVIHSFPEEEKNEEDGEGPEGVGRGVGGGWELRGNGGRGEELHDEEKKCTLRGCTVHSLPSRDNNWQTV